MLYWLCVADWFWGVSHILGHLHFRSISEPAQKVAEERLESAKIVYVVVLEKTKDFRANCVAMA